MSHCPPLALRAGVHLAFIAAVFASGCSLLFVEGPPARLEPGEKLTCSTSYAAPVIDGLITGFQVVRTGYAASQSDTAYRGMALSRPADIAIGSALTALFAISTGVGISRVSGCDELARGAPAPRRLEPTRGRGASWGAKSLVVEPSEEDDEVDEDEAAALQSRKAAAEARAAGEAAHRAGGGGTTGTK